MSSGSNNYKILTGDIGLDILLYDDVKYQGQIINAVITELKRRNEKRHISPNGIESR